MAKKKKTIALATSSLILGTLGAQGQLDAKALLDYASLGQASQVRAQLVRGEPVQQNSNWGFDDNNDDTPMEDDGHDQGQCGIGMCAPGSCGGGDDGGPPPTKNGDDQEDGDMGSCGDGTCGGAPPPKKKATSNKWRKASGKRNW